MMEHTVGDDRPAGQPWWPVIRVGTVLLLFALFGLLLTGMITDPDIWWHLAHGRWLWEHRAFPAADPFGVAGTPPASTLHTNFAFRQYWLAQLIYYGLYASGGLTALILLRALLGTALFAASYLLTRRAGAGTLSALILVSLSGAVVVREIGYLTDRPQLWTSLFAVVAVGLLMVLWSNLHGGYLVGDLLITIALLGGLLERRFPPRFWLTGIGALLASGLNPSGFSAAAVVARTVFDPRMRFSVQSMVESQSLLSHGGPWAIIRSMPALMVLTLMTAASFLPAFRRSGRMRSDRLLLFLVLLCLAVWEIRHLIYLATLAPVIVAGNLREPAGRHPRWRLPARAATLLLAAGLAWWLAVNGLGATALATPRPYDVSCDGAVDFIARTKLAGNLFDDYRNGGYLIWRLAPFIRPLVDGRNLSPQAFADYKTAMEQPFLRPSPNDDFRYTAILDRYRIDLVLIPGCDRDLGTIIPLALALLKDTRWGLVYADTSILLFVRDTPANRPVLESHLLPERAAYDHLAARARAASRSTHGRRLPEWQLTMAIAAAGTGNIEQALGWLDRYLAAVPGDKQAAEFRRSLLARL